MCLILQVLPELYGSYSAFLMSIDMPANQIKEIPEEMFSVLPNLAEFDCSSNYIEVLPASIGKCKKLYSLSLRENNFNDLPETLTQCKELWRLDIACNIMTEFPAVVTKLTWLVRLYASHMMLATLPEDIGNLTNLEKLFINGNCVTKLPASFTKLKNLEELGMSGVPLFGVAKSRKVVPYDQFTRFLKTRNIDRWLEAHDEVSCFSIFCMKGVGWWMGRGSVRELRGIKILQGYVFCAYTVYCINIIQDVDLHVLHVSVYE